MWCGWTFCVLWIVASLERMTCDNPEFSPPVLFLKANINGKLIPDSLEILPSTPKSSGFMREVPEHLLETPLGGIKKGHTTKRSATDDPDNLNPENTRATTNFMTDIPSLSLKNVVTEVNVQETFNGRTIERKPTAEELQEVQRKFYNNNEIDIDDDDAMLMDKEPSHQQPEDVEDIFQKEPSIAEDVDDMETILKDNEDPFIPDNDDEEFDKISELINKPSRKFYHTRTQNFSKVKEFNISISESEGDSFDEQEKDAESDWTEEIDFAEESTTTEPRLLNVIDTEANRGEEVNTVASVELALLNDLNLEANGSEEMERASEEGITKSAVTTESFSFAKEVVVASVEFTTLKSASVDPNSTSELHAMRANGSEEASVDLTQEITTDSALNSSDVTTESFAFAKEVVASSVGLTTLKSASVDPNGISELHAMRANGSEQLGKASVDLTQKTTTESALDLSDVTTESFSLDKEVVVSSVDFTTLKSASVDLNSTSELHLMRVNRSEEASVDLTQETTTDSALNSSGVTTEAFSFAKEVVVSSVDSSTIKSASVDSNSNNELHPTEENGGEQLEKVSRDFTQEGTSKSASNQSAVSTESFSFAKEVVGSSVDFTTLKPGSVDPHSTSELHAMRVNGSEELAKVSVDLGREATTKSVLNPPEVTIESFSLANEAKVSSVDFTTLKPASVDPNSTSKLHPMRANGSEELVTVSVDLTQEATTKSAFDQSEVSTESFSFAKETLESSVDSSTNKLHPMRANESEELSIASNYLTQEASTKSAVTTESFSPPREADVSSVDFTTLKPIVVDPNSTSELLPMKANGSENFSTPSVAPTEEATTESALNPSDATTESFSLTGEIDASSVNSTTLSPAGPDLNELNPMGATGSKDLSTPLVFLTQEETTKSALNPSEVTTESFSPSREADVLSVDFTTLKPTVVGPNSTSELNPMKANGSEDLSTPSVAPTEEATTESAMNPYEVTTESFSPSMEADVSSVDFTTLKPTGADPNSTNGFATLGVNASEELTTSSIDLLQELTSKSVILSTIEPDVTTEAMSTLSSVDFTDVPTIHEQLTEDQHIEEEVATVIQELTDSTVSPLTDNNDLPMTTDEPLVDSTTVKTIDPVTTPEDVQRPLEETVTETVEESSEESTISTILKLLTKVEPSPSEVASLFNKELEAIEEYEEDDFDEESTGSTGGFDGYEFLKKAKKTGRVEMEPVLRGTILNNSAEFSLKISRKNETFYVPSSAHIEECDNVLNITWRSFGGMNNSVVLKLLDKEDMGFYIIKEIITNLMWKENEFVSLKKPVAITPDAILDDTMPGRIRVVMMKDGTYVTFSNVEFLKKIAPVSNARENLDNPSTQSKLWHFEIATICLVSAIFIAIVLYVLATRTRKGQIALREKDDLPQVTHC
ncbi:mucin-3A-like [Anthonomus grandis grandis]|uniref:mucin-3A-like n=1 Tax=Anthonomus grandis grandis TaxID=2921223 RepID=UPI002165ECFB|nr:mucin-3A-like [Anthonomus grandis grandis]